MGAKLFIRIPKDPIILNCMIGSHGNHCNFIYSNWAYFYDNIFVIKAAPLNKLTYMRKYPRGARKVLLPAPFPLFQRLYFLYDFPSFYKFTHNNLWICN